jgi:hypothetical protein
MKKLCKVYCGGTWLSLAYREQEGAGDIIRPVCVPAASQWGPFRRGFSMFMALSLSPLSFFL